MTVENAKLAIQDGEGRNPIVLLIGFIVLIGAILVLLFGSTLFGSNDTIGEQAPVVDEIQIAQVELPTSGPPVLVGDTPYEFALQGIDGEIQTLSQFIGQPILINFWATWCGPCRIEMPEIQAVWEEYKDDGLVVLALDQNETADEVRAYFDELDLTFTPLLDVENNTVRNYGLGSSLPASIFINPDGQITALHRGAMTRGQLDSFLAQTIPDLELS